MATYTAHLIRNESINSNISLRGINSFICSYTPFIYSATIYLNLITQKVFTESAVCRLTCPPTLLEPLYHYYMDRRWWWWSCLTLSFAFLLIPIVSPSQLQFKHYRYYYYYSSFGMVCGCLHLNFCALNEVKVSP